jgi:hypothetical protein
MVLIPTGVTEKVFASAVFDAFKASATALGGSPDEVSHAVERAFHDAAESFLAEYGDRYPRPENAFVWRADNLERALESMRFSAQRLKGSDLFAEGINGAPTATPEELDFFAGALYQAMAGQAVLDRRLFMNAVLERLDRIGTLAAPAAGQRWSHADVARLSAQVRQVLDPRFLERVPRALVGRDYLRPLHDGLSRGGGVVLAIVGPAGFGKTTLLGQLYDELHSLEPGWIAAMLCADVDHHEGAGAAALAIEMGRALAGAPVPLAEVARRLNAEHGPGVLLIDTLDLIVSETTARSLRHILGEVASAGACVVFTCRDYEYDEFLARQDPGSGRAESFLRHKVPWFTTEEVRTAARRLVERKPPERRILDPDVFASRLLALSADSRPLRHIVYNPLLLSLVCELFDDALAIPADLTTSRLYDRYWADKVARGRPHSPARAGPTKAALALELAGILYARSGEFLVENARSEDLALSDDLHARSFRELVSEGVLTVTDTRRVRFFHQTFLEFAIARWLMMKEHRGEMDALLLTLRSHGGRAALHWWQVVRQLLAIAEPPEFDAVLRELDLHDMAAYRVVALAAVGAERPDVLLTLLELSALPGTGFRKALLFALASPSPGFFLPAWAAALNVLEGSRDMGEAMQAIELVGDLVALSTADAALRLCEALGTLDRWAAAGRPPTSRSIVLGTFLNTVSGWLEKNADDAVLAALREQYAHMGHTSRSLVVRMHLLPAATPQAREALLRQLLALPVAAEVVDDLVLLFSASAPWAAAGHAPLFASWSDALYRELPPGWELVRSRSAARAALGSPGLLRAVVDEFCRGPRERLEVNILTLHAVILAGGGESVCETFVQTPPDALGKERMSGISALVRRVAPSLSAGQRHRLGGWLRRVPAGPGSLPWVTAVAVLSTPGDAVAVAEERLSEFPLSDRVHAVTVALRTAPVETGRALAGWVSGQPGFRPFSHEAESLRLALHLLEARNGDSRAAASIMAIASGADRELAQRAAKGLLEQAAGPFRPTFDQLVPLAASKWPGVRKNALLVARARFEDGQPVPEAGLLALLEAFSRDTDRMVAHTLCELAANWMVKNRSAPPRLGEIVAGLVRPLVAAGAFDGGLARVVSYVFRVMAEAGEASLQAPLQEWTRDLLMVMGPGHLDNAQANVDGLLVALGRAEPAFFRSVLGLGPSLPARALRTFVMAVRKVEGARSALLTEMVLSAWCPPEMKRLVLDLRSG